MPEKVSPEKRKKLLDAYHDCKTQAEKDALYWSSSLLQGIYSAGNHGPNPTPAADQAAAPVPNAS